MHCPYPRLRQESTCSTSHFPRFSNHIVEDSWASSPLSLQLQGIPPRYAAADFPASDCNEATVPLSPMPVNEPRLLQENDAEQHNGAGEGEVAAFPPVATTVSTAAELSTAIAAGTQHIVLKSHLDLTGPEAVDDDFGNAATLPATVQSITVRPCPAGTDRHGHLAREASLATISEHTPLRPYSVAHIPHKVPRGIQGCGSCVVYASKENCGHSCGPPQLPVAATPRCDVRGGMNPSGGLSLIHI